MLAHPWLKSFSSRSPATDPITPSQSSGDRSVTVETPVKASVPFDQQRKSPDIVQQQSSLLIDGFNVSYARPLVLMTKNLMSTPSVTARMSQVADSSDSTSSAPSAVPQAVAAPPRAVAAPHAFSISNLADTFIASARSNLGLPPYSKDIQIKDKPRDLDLFESVSQELHATVYILK